MLWSVKFCNKATIARSVTVLIGLLNMVETDARVKVEIISTQDKIAVVKIVGKIKSEEDLELKQELAKLHGAGYSLKLNAIVLDTGGGSGVAAQAMGRLIRENKLNTFVPPSGSCDSACIAVLSGGLVRMAYGKVTVHRSTFDDDFPPERLEKALHDADERFSQHIRDMGLSPMLIDAIMMTPNWGYRILDDKDKRRWGVHATDRLYEEMWFRNTASQTKYSIEVIRRFFYRHYAKCNSQQKRFESTLWDCVRKEIY